MTQRSNFYLVYLVGCSEHDELDSAPRVALRGHGAPQCLHGSMVGSSQERFAVDGYQLVVHAQPPVLWRHGERS